MPGKYDDLILIMNEVKELIDSPDTDITWSEYDSVEEAIKDIDYIIRELKQKDELVTGKIRILFAPTSTYQEISISSGWSTKYLELANRVDELFKINK